ncbi:energy-coupling factor transporter transmembrane component T [Romboutsia lituseburensis]|uniref:energy-coupling factor transporter transmembrane component T n=1 Tax=Romboutsia lituseburensis TaxID=1537 RepID=UPI00215B5FC6|nr:energy-coupling factor transporter transmembrane protein EcfT [Romboutsia lituseburensis]MCR8743802.1 energy-coupling factor transporter transmembrane protein EcfT [Romboutsia lituseburensis]
MERALGAYHPLVSFTYFVVVIGTSMLCMHPIFVVISLISGTLYSFIINREKTKQILKFSSLMIILITLANVIFVNRGVTVLFYLRGNPITLESFLYGILSGLMMACVIVWFSCYNEIVTSDKFLYIFGKTLPSIALMASMTLGLIPKLINQTKVIASTQKTIGIDYEEGTIIKKIKSSMRILSIVVTWALEDAVQTADSMKARGYGIKGRTNFTIFIFIKRDIIMLGFIWIVAVFLGSAYSNGYCQLLFYPTIQSIRLDTLSTILYLSFFIITIIPIVLELWEGYKWKY